MKDSDFNNPSLFFSHYKALGTVGKGSLLPRIMCA